MTSIERNFNGVIYKVTVKEEEQRRRMAEREDKEGEEVTLEEQKPKMTEAETEATGSIGCAMHRHEGTKPCSGPWRSLSSGLEAPSSSVEAPSVEAPSVKVVDLCFVVEGSQSVFCPQNIRHLEGVEPGGEGWP